MSPDSDSLDVDNPGMGRSDVDSWLLGLQDTIASVPSAAVAVSGGVDSMTLAAICANTFGDRFVAIHAVSPAVPEQATRRVREYAARFGWRLEVVEAREFADPDYLANPFNRCYFCKRNLYDRIAEVTSEQVFSGANADDLGDFRPGLVAARERSVRHPYVEVGADKTVVRALAAHLGLEEVKALPAMPCLSSRVESGIRINAQDLALVNTVEERLREHLAAHTVRCRITHEGVHIELDEPARMHLDGVEGGRWRDHVQLDVEGLCRDHGHTFGGFKEYVQGSAFIRE